VTDSIVDAREAFRATELRLRLQLLGDGSETPGLVKGEDARRRIGSELRHLREAVDALAEEASRATTATAQVADLERELLRVAAQRAAAVPQPSSDPALLTPAECAQALRVSVSTVYRAVKRGEIRAVKPTGHKRGALRIAASELERLLEPPGGRRPDYSEGSGSAGTSTALNRAPRHETASTPSRLISSSLQPNMRT
jgi:excisionase family DNA binding protein